MKYFLGVLFIVSFQLSAQCKSFDSKDSIDIDNLVNNLNGDNWTKTRNKLFSSPKLSMKALIFSLKATKPGVFANEKVGADVWKMRTIHALTGLRFQVYPREILEENFKSILDFDGDGKLNFYGNWMSRGVDHVAPVDVQERIIKKWVEWAQVHIETHQYICSDSWDYFFQ